MFFVGLLSTIFATLGAVDARLNSISAFSSANWAQGFSGYCIEPAGTSVYFGFSFSVPKALRQTTFDFTLKKLEVKPTQSPSTILLQPDMAGHSVSLFVQNYRCLPTNIRLKSVEVKCDVVALMPNSLNYASEYELSATLSHFHSRDDVQVLLSTTLNQCNRNWRSPQQSPSSITPVPLQRLHQSQQIQQTASNAAPRIQRVSPPENNEYFWDRFASGGVPCPVCNDEGDRCDHCGRYTAVLY